MIIEEVTPDLAVIIKQGKKQLYRCCICNMEVRRFPSQVSERIFCSHKCRNTGYIVSYPVGHKCNDYTVINEVVNEDNKQLAECKCGNRDFILTWRLNPSNQVAITMCKRCQSDCRKITGLTKDYLSLEYSQNKKSVNDIAKELNCGQTTVRRRLREYGIELNAFDPVLRRHINPELHNLSGNIVGKWTVGRKTEKHGEIYYHCTCRCGNIRIIRGSRLLDEHDFFCKSCFGKTKRGTNSPYWIGHEDISGRNFNKYINDAVIRDIEFDVDIEYLWELFLKQGKRCALTGIPIAMTIYHGKRESASLDRIDSRLGYKDGNVQWVHKTVNRMKWAIPEQTFIELCTSVTKWQRCPGKINEIDGDTFLSGRWEKERNEGPFCHRWSGYGGITGTYWRTIVSGATERNLEFDIEISEMWKMFLKQGACCAYSGLPLEMKRNCRDRNWSASIDRIDSSKPYTKENVCWAHTTINTMKLDMSVNEFFQWCRAIADHADHKLTIKEQ